MLTWNGGVNGSNVLFSLRGTGQGTVAGVIATGLAGLSKGGSGAWTLTGLNTFTGKTTIGGGTLAFNTIGDVGSGPSSLGNPADATAGRIDLMGTLSYIGATAARTGRSTFGGRGAGRFRPGRGAL